MNLLILCEGDAETRHGSFSGITNSLLVHLRAAGHLVAAGDVDLYGWRRLVAAAATFAPRRSRWAVRFRLGGVPSLLRTSVASGHIRRSSGLDAILQIGATFKPRGRGNTPYFLFCDSNIRMAERGVASGQSQAASLNAGELGTVIARETSVYQEAAGIFTLSERLRQSFLEDFGLPATRVHTAHGGPNFEPSDIPEQPDDHRDGQPPTILFVGVGFERKGGDLLLQAFERVREVLPDVRLIIVGPRSLEVTSPGIECLGFLSKDDPADWKKLVAAYSTADVFCLPTRYEPFGIVFIEAMFFGLPCIGPNAWAIPEMVSDGETGFLVPPEDVGALTERLLLLLKNPELARTMGQAGRARANARFTWPAVVARITEQIDKVLHRPNHES